MVAVIAAIGGENRRPSRRQLRSSVLDKSTAGRLLRQQREQVSGRWQGPLAVPAGSVMVCVSLGSMADDLAAELLVRILREQKIDARHMSIEDLEARAAAECGGGRVHRLRGQRLSERGAQPRRGHGRGRCASVFPNACIVAVFLPGMLLQEDEVGAGPTMHEARTSRRDHWATRCRSASICSRNWHTVTGRGQDRADHGRGARARIGRRHPAVAARIPRHPGRHSIRRSTGRASCATRAQRREGVLRRCVLGEPLCMELGARLSAASVAPSTDW